MSSLSTEFVSIPFEKLVDTEKCIICIEDLDRDRPIVAHNGTIIHLFHKTCLRDWVNQKSSCPTCFREITKIDGVEVQRAIPQEENNRRQQVEEIINRRRIFRTISLTSGFVGTIFILRNIFMESSVNVYMATGCYAVSLISIIAVEHNANLLR